MRFELSVAAAAWFLSVAVVPMAAAQQPEESMSAPFGLTWGMSKSEAQALGVEFSEAEVTKWGDTVGATGLPTMVADVRAVYLFFGYEDQLWRIMAVSEPFQNDPYGHRVRERYSQLQQVLESKYGKGVTLHHAAEFYTGDNWVLGIKSGQNWHATTFSADAVTAQIRVAANDGSTPYYILNYEHDELAVGVEAGRQQHERDAL